MVDQADKEKTVDSASKPFMAAGPTLGYDRRGVIWCWSLALAAFAAACLFWSKIVTGSFWSFDYQTAASVEFWDLGRFVTTGVSIFEYPAQIHVLGLLMGILAVGPVLISQLLSFRYSLPFILAVFFLANLPGFAVCVLVSCFGAACRPLRFRSRFTAIALCTAPQLLYWGYFGRTGGGDPIKWGFAFTPWISAWVIALAIAGLVLGIGHYTRYRPGLIWACTVLVFLAAAIVFNVNIGFGELDYRLYVAKNDPEQIEEFHEHSITEVLDETITDPAFRKYLAGFFYPAEPIPLREELKKEIQVQLTLDRWPSWFAAPPHLRYQAKRHWLLAQYELFISRRPKSRRMPIALYYKALLSEYSPDIAWLGQKEKLRFYSDYPHRETLPTWYRLYDEFGDSAESLEARYRIAMHLAGQGEFEKANQLVTEAQTMLSEKLKQVSNNRAEPQKGTLSDMFKPPADTVVTDFRLAELQRKLNQLYSLIGRENRPSSAASAKRLARFIMLNPHDADYAGALDELLEQMGEKDLLRDNVLLARTKLIPDEQLRAEKLSQLHENFHDTDAGMQALYELALLKMQLWRLQGESDAEQKKQRKKYLVDAKATLTRFITMYPEGIFTEQVRKNLESLPAASP